LFRTNLKFEITAPIFYKRCANSDNDTRKILIFLIFIITIPSYPDGLDHRKSREEELT